MSNAVALRAEGTFSEEMLFLSHIKQHFDGRCSPHLVMSLLSQGLHQFRATLPAARWATFAHECHHHPVASIIHQDPFTSWSFRKPRGYAGDAQLLDFIYEDVTVAEHITKATLTGQAIYSFTKALVGAVAVCERRDILASLIDRIASEKGGDIEVLAIAAGHLREAEQSVAFRAGGVKRWIALDQDRASIAHIGERLEGSAVRIQEGSVRGLLAEKYDLGQFDLVYAAGLYDYLVPKVANRLTQLAFEMLKPGGTYLFANFADDIPDDGYIETFMDWHLILRNEEEIKAICASITHPDVAETDVFFGANRNIIYGTLQRS